MDNSGVQMTVNDIPFSKVMVINKVTRPAYDVENTTHELKNVDGVKMASTRLKEAKITVDCTLVSDEENNFMRVQDLEDWVKQKCNTKGDLRIVFSDFPDRYWTGRLDGEANTDIVTEGLGTLTLNFTIPEGVSHSIYTTVATNFKEGYAGENLVLDPEFRYLNKYYQPWTYLSEEKHNGHRVLSADFDDSTDTIHDETYRRMTQGKLNLRKVNVKKGDKFSAGIWVKIRKMAAGDTDGRASFQLTIDEYGALGGPRLDWTTVTLINQGAVLNEWFYFKIENLPIKQVQTKYIALAPVVKRDSSVDISQPQLNLGTTVLPYTEPDSQFLETIPLPNNGTYPCWPTIKATLNGESGLFSLINSNGGVLQFGNPEDLDIKEGKRSDKIVNYSFYGSKPVTELKTNNGGVTSYPNYLSDPTLPNLVQGSVYYTRSVHTMDPKFDDVTEKVWHGPRMWMDVDKNYSNQNTGDFQWVNRLDFQSTKKQVGRIEFYLYDEKGKAIFGGVVRDSQETKSTLSVEYHGPNGKVVSKTLSKKKFIGKWFEFKFWRKSNRYYWQFAQVKSADNDKAKLSVKDTFDLNLADVGDVQICGMSVWFEKLGSKPVAHESWNHTKFEWLNETTWSNIPNLFDDGDEIEVDTENKQLLINGVVEQDSAYLSIDNQWDLFHIDKDYNEIQCVVSDWANTPEVSVEFEEAYL